MKSPLRNTILAVTLLLSFALLSSETVRAASIVRNDTWIGRLPEPKGLNVGAVKVKRTAPNPWVRFEAPAVARRGTLTLSSGTLQFLKGGVRLPMLHAAEFLVQPLTLADVEMAGSLMSSFEVANVENASLAALTLANTSELRQAAVVFNPLPFEQSIAADLATGDNFGSAIAPNSISTVASSASETPSAEPATVPVPEPSVAALSALVVTGMLARRRRG